MLEQKERKKRECETKQKLKLKWQEIPSTGK